MTPIRRKNGWAAKFVLNGRQHWVPGSPFPTKSAAREAEQRYRDRLNARRSEETCASFSERWLEEWPRPAEATRRLYAASAKRFADHFGPTPIGEIERLEARAWALGVPRKVSQVIGTMFEDARNVGLVKDNPFSNMRLPVTERRAEVKPPTMDEYKALLDACPILGGYGPEFRAMIQFSAWTGIRQGELFGLQWDDVGRGAATEGAGAEAAVSPNPSFSPSPSADLIHVRRSRKLDGSLGPPKNGRERLMPIRVEAQVLDRVPRRPDSFIFHSPRGQPLLKQTHAWSWNKVRASAHVNCRWHSLRHFCATELLALGYSHFDVSVQLGHTDGGALVMSRYGHPSVEAAQRRLLAPLELPEVKRAEVGHG